MEVVVVVVDSHVQRIVLVTEETAVTQPVSHRPIKCQPLSSQRGTKVDGSYHDESPLLKPTAIQPTNREHRKLSASRRCLLGTNYIFYYISGVLLVFHKLNYKLYREDCLMCCSTNKVVKSDTKRFLALGGY